MRLLRYEVLKLCIIYGLDQKQFDSCRSLNIIIYFFYGCQWFPFSYDPEAFIEKAMMGHDTLGATTCDNSDH